MCFAGQYDDFLNDLNRRDIVLDGGANIGVLAVLASQRVAKVYAVEPDHSNFGLLKRNISLNDTRNIFANQIALLAQPGLARINGVGIGVRVSEVGNLVRADTIDRAYSDVTAIKLDIEGSEIMALRGAKKTLPNVRILIVETHATETEVVKILEKEHYIVSEVKSNKKKWLGHKLLSPNIIYDELTSKFALTKEAKNFFSPQNLYRNMLTKTYLGRRM